MEKIHALILRLERTLLPQYPQMYTLLTYLVFFSEVIAPAPVAPTVRLPEYFTTDKSRHPTPNFADSPLRVTDVTKYDPRFPIPTERFTKNNDTISKKRKVVHFKRLQNLYLERKFEVKVRFQKLNAHPHFQLVKIQHQTIPAAFVNTSVDFNRELALPDLALDKNLFYNSYSGLKYKTPF